MAPTRTVSSKLGSAKSIKSGGRKSSQSKSRNDQNNKGFKTRVLKQAKGPPPKQQKTKSAPGPVKKKPRIYTEKELGIPKLNMITPAGVQLPKGKKKGKVFVDDQESMVTILAIVNATKEGQIESKMMKSRQMEEIREARRKEAEARQERKKLQLEETKDSLRRGRKRKRDSIAQQENAASEAQVSKGVKSNQKRVSFA